MQEVRLSFTRPQSIQSFSTISSHKKLYRIQTIELLITEHIFFQKSDLSFLISSFLKAGYLPYLDTVQTFFKTSECLTDLSDCQNLFEKEPTKSNSAEGKRLLKKFRYPSKFYTKKFSISRKSVLKPSQYFIKVFPRLGEQLFSYALKTFWNTAYKKFSESIH